MDLDLDLDLGLDLDLDLNLDLDLDWCQNRIQSTTKQINFHGILTVGPVCLNPFQSSRHLLMTNYWRYLCAVYYSKTTVLFCQYMKQLQYLSASLDPKKTS